jgi:hypothetical protein
MSTENDVSLQEFAQYRVPVSLPLPLIVQTKAVTSKIIEKIVESARSIWNRKYHIFRRILTGYEPESITIESDDSDLSESEDMSDDDSDKDMSNNDSEDSNVEDDADDDSDTSEENSIDTLWMKELELGKPRLNLDKNDLSSILQPSLTWDVDSILAITTTLELLNVDIKVDLCPNITANLTGSVHLALHGKAVEDIPQMRFIKFHHETMEYNVILLAPNAKSYNCNMMNESLIEGFVDEIWLPAIRKVLHPNDAASWPAKFRVIKGKSQFPAKSKVPLKTSGAKTGSQTIPYTVPKRHIAEVWKICQRKLTNVFQQEEASVLHQLRNFRWLITGKNFKDSTSKETLGDVLTFCRDSVISYRFKANIKILPLFNARMLNRDEFFVDLASKNGVEGKGFTVLWRKCCLKEFMKVLRMDDERGSKCQEREYSWCHTRDVGGASSAPRVRSAARMAGLIYWQGYLMNKGQFDGNKT